MGHQTAQPLLDRANPEELIGVALVAPATTRVLQPVRTRARPYLEVGLGSVYPREVSYPGLRAPLCLHRVGCFEISTQQPGPASHTSQLGSRHLAG